MKLIQQGADGRTSQGATEGCGSFESSRMGDIPAGHRTLRKLGLQLAGSETGAPGWHKAFEDEDENEEEGGRYYHQ